MIMTIEAAGNQIDISVLEKSIAWIQNTHGEPEWAAKIVNFISNTFPKYRLDVFKFEKNQSRSSETYRVEAKWTIAD